MHVDRQLDNGRYRMGYCHIGRTGAEGEGTVVGKEASQRREVSKHNEASTLESIVRSEIPLTQCKMGKADHFVRSAESYGTMWVNPRD